MSSQDRSQTVSRPLGKRLHHFLIPVLFVYVHVVWFACWIGFGVEDYPHGLLTMIVSLEAIFLSTFVLISQNRADARRQVIADQPSSGRVSGDQRDFPAHSRSASLSIRSSRS
jgi:uncharacterized membrane protein